MKKRLKSRCYLRFQKLRCFLLAGLSLLVHDRDCRHFVFGIGAEFANYWVWLVGGAAYFPLLMIISHVRDSEFLPICHSNASCA